MFRSLIGGGIGSILGLLALPVWGAWYGYVHGGPAAHHLPGADAALRQALFFIAYFSWIAIPAGAMLGGFVGFLSWVVRWPALRRSRREARRSPAAPASQAFPGSRAGAGE